MSLSPRLQSIVPRREAMYAELRSPHRMRGKFGGLVVASIFDLAA